MNIVILQRENVFSFSREYGESISLRLSNKVIVPSYNISGIIDKKESKKIIFPHPIKNKKLMSRMRGEIIFKTILKFKKSEYSFKTIDSTSTKKILKIDIEVIR